MIDVKLLPEPQFGDWLRGIYASESNPQRDGMYVRTILRSGSVNPGKHYELTDGKGGFWQYPAKSTERINRASRPADVARPVEAADYAARFILDFSALTYSPHSCERAAERLKEALRPFTATQQEVQS